MIIIPTATDVPFVHADMVCVCVSFRLRFTRASNQSDLQGGNSSRPGGAIDAKGGLPAALHVLFSHQFCYMVPGWVKMVPTKDNMFTWIIFTNKGLFHLSSWVGIGAMRFAARMTRAEMSSRSLMRAPWRDSRLFAAQKVLKWVFEELPIEQISF